MASVSEVATQLVLGQAGQNIPSKPELALYTTGGLLYAGFVLALGAYAAQRALAAAFE